MRHTRRRRPATLLAITAVAAATATLAACASTANAGSTPSPKSYENLRDMVADADVVVRGTAETSTEETVDDVPYTRTAFSVVDVVLGNPESDNILVGQIGTRERPADGLPDVVEPGRTYVLVLDRTGDSTYDVVGPGIWWNPTGEKAELFVSSGGVDPRIPHETTTGDLVTTIEGYGDALSSGG
ncbi:cupin domain-containing protein [Myceligenerans cantabricum]